MEGSVRIEEISLVSTEALADVVCGRTREGMTGGTVMAQVQPDGG